MHHWRNQFFAAVSACFVVMPLTAVMPYAHAGAPAGQPSGEVSTADTSFEKAKPGVFKKLETAAGVWTAVSGVSIVDHKHARTGNQCLQLTGGQSTVVTLNLPAGLKTGRRLSFWAERWTQRKPFSFRIEQRGDNGWKEIYNGDQTVRVGRGFRSYVEVNLGGGNSRQLRFSVTSPPATGVLIDDLRVAPSQPQKIVSVQAVPVTLPALVGNAASPLMKLQVKTVGNLHPISLTQLRGKVTGLKNIAALHLASSTSGVRTPLLLPDGAGEVTWKPEPFELVEGDNTILLGCQLKKTANIDQRAGLSLTGVTFSNGKTIQLKNATSTQRLGVAVRNQGDDGVHTFRIPGLATTTKGTLIGVYDVRRRTGGDLPGDIDVGMSRSTDGGHSWQPMKIIMDMGDDPAWRYDGAGDPAVLVDKTTGVIWVAATWSHGDRSWRGSGPGLKPEETGQLLLVHSDDDGLTWSKPINITAEVKKPEWCFLLQGPGKGITMRDGTLVFAAQYQDPPAQNRLPHSTIIYSKDHGKTWQCGAGAFDDTTEAQVVETEPGVLMLNCRYNRAAVRVVMTTRDMGKTWQKHPTSMRSLIEPGSCMASLINVAAETGDKAAGWLLFSNPDSTRGRRRTMIKASADLGQTWPAQQRLLLDEGNSAGYSCMSMIDAKTVGILYEGSQSQMTFQRIPLREITGVPNAEEPPIIAPLE